MQAGLKTHSDTPVLEEKKEKMSARMFSLREEDIDSIDDLKSVSYKVEDDFSEKDLIFLYQQQSSYSQFEDFKKNNLNHEVFFNEVKKSLYSAMNNNDRIIFLKIIQHQNFSAIQKICLPFISKNLQAVINLDSNQQTFFSRKSETTLVEISTSRETGYKKYLIKLRLLWLSENIKQSINDIKFSTDEKQKYSKKIKLLANKLFSLSLSIEILESLFLTLKDIGQHQEKQGKLVTVKDIDELITYIGFLSVKPNRIKLKLVANILSSKKWNSIAELQRVFAVEFLQHLCQEKLNQVTSEELEFIVHYLDLLLKNDPKQFEDLRQYVAEFFSKININNLKLILVTLYDYNLLLTNEKILKILTTESLDAVAASLHRYALDNIFLAEEHTLNRDELIEKYQSHAENKEVKHRDLSTKLDQIEKLTMGESLPKHQSGITDKPLPQWTEEDIRKWARVVKTQKNIDTLEALAIMGHAVILLHHKQVAQSRQDDPRDNKDKAPESCNFLIRNTQYLAVIELANKQKRLAEIQTGEGKSLIVAMLAVLHALNGKEVDIITSSSELAKRDAEYQQAFYACFDLTVAHNIIDTDKSTSYREAVIAVYQKNIVYGDASHFQADILREQFFQIKTRQNRKQTTAIVDEVDSMFIDQGGDSTRLSSEDFLGAHHFKYILAFIWKQLTDYDRALGEKIADIDQQLLWRQLHSSVMNFTGMRWYNNQDIMTYVHFIIQTQKGGFEDKCCYLLREKRKEYHIAVTGACSDQTEQPGKAAAPKIDYYFNKNNWAQINGEFDSPNDVFDEIEPILKGKLPAQVKILFPYSVTANRWFLGEIQIKKYKTSRYEITIFVHDSNGAAELESHEFKRLSAAISQRLGQIDPASSLLENIDIKSHLSPYSKPRLQSGEWNGYGCVVASELIKRIDDLDLTDRYPLGCRELRDQQRDALRNQYTIEIVDGKPKNPQDNRIYCYPVNQDEDQVWGYSVNSSHGIIKIDKSSPEENRVLQILIAFQTKKKLDDEELYFLITEILIKAGMQDQDSISNFVKNHKVNYHIPDHWLGVFLHLLPYWIDSALEAKYEMFLDKQYCVKGDKILIIDHSSTGVIQKSSQWEHGRHQMLQLKHQLELTPLNLVSNFLTSSSFFKGYDQLCGVTGTLGSKAQQEYLEKTYSVDCIFLPTFKSRQLISLNSNLLPDETSWHEAIVQIAYREVNAGRAVLIIFDSILAAKQFKKILQEKLKTKSKFCIKEYTDSEDEQQKRTTERPVESGDIIIATNLAGRGADFENTEPVVLAKGLHTCIGFFPKNNRVERQAAGRSGRKGQPGTWQIIANRYELLEQGYQKLEDIVELGEERNQNEISDMLHLQTYRNPINDCKQKLFNKFCELLSTNKQEQKFHSKEVNTILWRAVTEHWSVWFQVNFDETLLMFDSNKDDLVTPASLDDKLKIAEVNFDLFWKSIQENLQKKDYLQIITNPYLLILLGNTYIASANNIKLQKDDDSGFKSEDMHGHYHEAIKCYQLARKYDTNCYWLAYHQEAFAWAAKSEQSSLCSGITYQIDNAEADETKQLPASSTSVESQSQSELSSSTERGADEKKSPDTPPKKTHVYSDDSDLKQAQDCLVASKTHLNNSVLSTAQAYYGLIYPGAVSHIKIVLYPPQRQQVIREPETIWFRQDKQLWHYWVCVDFTQEKVVDGIVNDEKTIADIECWNKHQTDKRGVRLEAKETDEYFIKEIFSQDESQQVTVRIIEYITKICNLSKRNKTPLIGALNKEILFYQDLIGRVDDGLVTLGESKKIKVSWDLGQTSVDIFENECQQIGFKGAIGITKHEIKPFPWEVIGIGLLAAAQIIVGGILVASGVCATVGSGLIAEGVGDILFAIQVAITGEFSWEDYIKQKLISIAISVTTAGAVAFVKWAGSIAKLGYLSVKVSRFGIAVGKAITAIKKAVSVVLKPIKAIYQTLKKLVLFVAKRLSSPQINFVEKAVAKGFKTVLKLIAKEMIQQAAVSGLTQVFESTVMKILTKELVIKLKNELKAKLLQHESLPASINKIIGFSAFLSSKDLLRNLYEIFNDNLKSNTSEWEEKLMSSSRQVIEGAISGVLKEKYKPISELVRLMMSCFEIAKILQFSDEIIRKISLKTIELIDKTQLVIDDKLALTESEYKDKVIEFRRTAPESLKQIQWNLLESIYQQFLGIGLLNNTKKIMLPDDPEQAHKQILQQEIIINGQALNPQSKSMLVFILIRLRKRRQEQITIMDREYVQRKDDAIDYLASCLSEKMVVVFARETMHHAKRATTKFVSHVGDKIIPKAELAQEMKLLSKQRKQRELLKKSTSVSKLSIFSEKIQKPFNTLNQKIEICTQQLIYQQLIQKTQGLSGQSCRGNLLHIIALSEKFGIPLIVYNIQNKNELMVSNNPKQAKKTKPLILIYDEDNQGHYSFCEVKDNELSPKEFSLIDKNDCLFASFEHYLTGKNPTAEGLKQLRGDAASYLETGLHRKRLSTLYYRLEEHNLLLKGGTNNRYIVKRPDFTAKTKSEIPVAFNQDRRHGLHFDECIRKPFQQFIDTVIHFEGEGGLRIRLDNMMEKKNLLRRPIDIQKKIDALVSSFNSDKGNLAAGDGSGNKAIENTRRMVNQLLERVEQGHLSPAQLRAELATKLNMNPNPHSEISSISNEHIQFMLTYKGNHDEFCELLKDVSESLTIDIAHNSTDRDFNIKTLEQYHLLKKLIRNLENTQNVNFTEATMTLNDFQVKFLDIYPQARQTKPQTRPQARPQVRSQRRSHLTQRTGTGYPY